MPQALPTSASDLGTASAEASVAREFDNLRVTGFSLAMAWHMLALFAIAPQSASLDAASEPLVLQLSLYISSALTFLVLTMTIGRNAWKSLVGNAVLKGSAVLSCAACLASAFTFFSFSFDFTARFTCFCLLGVVDALFLMAMLAARGFSGGCGEQYRGIAMNAALGSLAAFVVMFVIEPLSWILFCLLPLAAYAANRLGKVDADLPESDLENSGAEYEGIKGATFHACAFGLAFGLCQGSLVLPLSGTGMPSFSTSLSWIPVAELVAAVSLYFVSEHDLSERGHSLIVRLGASLLLAGALASALLLIVGPALPQSVAPVSFVANALMLAGFCSYCTGFLAALPYSCVKRTARGRYLSLNRLLCCIGLASGLAIGDFLAAGVLPSVENASFVAIGTAGLVICLTCAPPLDRLLPGIKDRATSARDLRETDEARPVEAEGETKPAYRTRADVGEVESADTPVETTSATRRGAEDGKNADSASSRGESFYRPPRSSSSGSATEAIAQDFNLSRREHEILCYLAHGRNAAFIQQELQISINTVKTHIANIYGKIGAHSIQDVIDLVEKYHQASDDANPASRDPQDAAAISPEEATPEPAIPSHEEAKSGEDPF